jgi:hypothetical protein
MKSRESFDTSMFVNPISCVFCICIHLVAVFVAVLTSKIRENAYMRKPAIPYRKRAGPAIRKRMAYTGSVQKSPSEAEAFSYYGCGDRI